MCLPARRGQRRSASGRLYKDVCVAFMTLGIQVLSSIRACSLPMGSLLGPHSSTASLAVSGVAPSGLRAWRETMRSLATAFPFIGDTLRLCACDGSGVRVPERPEARTSTRSMARMLLSPRTYASVSVTSRSLLSRLACFLFQFNEANSCSVRGGCFVNDPYFPLLGLMLFFV